MAEVAGVERTELGGDARYRDFQITYAAPEY
jgi:hypothetical protein